MRARRRVDWPLILAAGEPLPAVRPGETRPDARALSLAFQELSSIPELDAVLRRTVELARESIGVERAAIFLVNRAARLMMGTWGTDLERRTVDEHGVMCDLSADADEVFRRATEQGMLWTLVDNCPIVEQLEGETRVSGRSWVVCTPIVTAERATGMMFNDAGRRGARVDPALQDSLALLCAFVGALLDLRAASSEPPAPFRSTSRLISSVVAELATTPSLSGAALAKKHGVSVSLLARAFKAEMGMSIVEHRNRLRLRRFFRLVEEGAGLLPAALEAGFGSYAQFHRVFRALYQSSPAVFLGRRERRSA